ncbi:hypothetical protein RclHR1_02420015 [Rhizophagus clarus]|uniref:Protein ZIP4 homolog n=1 Tax=Rhizophagus clarus TaxID=94130 RepID=A0A2Z6RRY9_9GLOM|nr:hypothetical protein RclHR1_02420015 [Rhizophagus clarus]
MFKTTSKPSRNDAPFFLTLDGKRVSASSTLSDDFTFSLNNEDISEKSDQKAIGTRLKKQLEVISALVKDVNEKINRNPLDTKFTQDSLKEILRSVEQFTNLQKVAQNFELSDEIDELGVGLWNSSIALKTISDSSGTDDLIALHCGRSDQADDVLRSANEILFITQIEDSVLSLQNVTAKEQYSKSAALLVYYAYRAEAAWKLANVHVANLMFQHATDKNYLEYVTAKETNTLNILANCYLKNIVYDESNLDLAENAVNLCLEENPGNALSTLLKLKIMKQKDFTPIQIEGVYIPFIRNSQVTKENLKILLNITHFISEINVMTALRGIDILIEEKLADMRNVSYVEKAIISKFHMLENGDSIDLEVNDIISSVEVTLGFEQRHGIVIGHRTRVACQLILWQNGDRNYSNQDYERAKKWYLIAYKWLASNQTNNRNAAILQRKIALCYLEDDALADAIEAVHKAQLHEDNSSANFYILYHIAMEKRQNDQAIQYLSDMCNGNGFSGNMLAMAAHEAYKKGNKEVLIETLQEILKKHKNGENIANINILVLIRCLIRMTHNSLSSDMEKNSLKECICNYFEIASTLNDTMVEDINNKINETGICQPKKVPLNDFEWFFKTGFCHQSDNGNDLYAVRLIEISHKKEILEQVLDKIEQYKKIKVLGKRKFDNIENDGQSTSQKDLMLILLFEYEAKAKLGLWDKLQVVINATEAFDFEIPSKIFERMGKYPPDEIQWLMVNAWNCGIDYYS